MGVADRLKHAWNAFLKDPTPASVDTGPSFFYRPDRPRLSRGNDRSLIAAIFNRIAMDAAALDIEHVQLDEEKRYVGTVNSGLNNCLTLEANIDQTGRAFIQDVVFVMLDKGNVAIVPTDTDVNPVHSGGYDIVTMRAGEVVEWYPQYVKVRLYNDKTGQMSDQKFPKKMVSIVENPLYATINQPNSTLQRLMRKLVLIDAVDEETSSGKLNMIIQLPYIIKTDARRQQAENRRKDLEEQLRSSKYGVAYADGTEKIMQLNRPLENDLLAQIEYLTNMLYSQLGLTDAVLNGTASEEEMQNYYSRTIEPILSAITDEMKRKFLTKNARTRGQSIKYFRDPFKLITISGIAEIGDTLTRNEVLTSNELRQILGLKPSDNPRADELVNKNMPIEDLGIQNEMPVDGMEDPQGDYDELGGELDSFDTQLDELEGMLNHSEFLAHKTYANPYYDPVKAHEYYMKNRELKGRSTSGLNEEGKFTAKAIKEALDKERDDAIDSHRKQTDRSIEKSRSQMRSSIEQGRSQTTAAVNLNNTNTSNAISTNTDQMNSALKQQRDAVKSKIKTESRRMSNQISMIREQLSKMGPNQRKARKEEFQRKIDELRQNNEDYRDELNSAYSEFSDTTRAKNKKENTDLKENTARKNENLRDENRKNAEETKEKHAKEKSDLKEGHAKRKKELKEEYDEKYEAELAKIYKDANMLKPEKTKSSGGRKSGKAAKSGSGQRESKYKRSESKVKAIRKKYGV